MKESETSEDTKFMFYIWSSIRSTSALSGFIIGPNLFLLDTSTVGM